MSPNTGEYIINSPRKLILLKSVRGAILKWQKNGVIKKKVENDGEHIIIPVF
jgi:hypothetical protein